jgi:hypothetical protein
MWIKTLILRHSQKEAGKWHWRWSVNVGGEGKAEGVIERKCTGNHRHIRIIFVKGTQSSLSTLVFGSGLDFATGRRGGGVAVME